MILIIPVFLWVIAPLPAKAIYSDDLNPSGCKFRDMQAFYMAELAIEPDVSIEYVYLRMPEPNMLGYTRPLKNGNYQIALAKGLEPSEVRITMAHELVHVRQLENKQIRVSEFQKHYMERSFEDEAFRLSIPLAIKFYTGHTCQKPTAEAL
ncbi:ImmA/IrrE family metallo-endopeptidase [Endozoicomonas sp. SCSIO W0465]|uniref:ImmA/IrrE family metallo-endopeptidase n=1 Tax=Endozoicomonas sp. SCSIO W0465 TaxID=2918516 RepID=UPI002074FFF8|nr:ImmA/IrrE family metallo-endopeptidase [Endozoicomonas sp. SCSIO W0465]USE38298.1 ImmA/IrrE family metallo-endopeptidase [Endozoicomonas sp. SCSIO W0465]